MVGVDVYLQLLLRPLNSSNSMFLELVRSTYETSIDKKIPIKFYMVKGKVKKEIVYYDLCSDGFENILEYENISIEYAMVSAMSRQHAGPHISRVLGMFYRLTVIYQTT